MHGGGIMSHYVVLDLEMCSLHRERIDDDELYNEIIQPYFIKKEQQLCSFIDAYEIYRPEVEEIIKAEKQQLNILQEKIQ